MGWDFSLTATRIHFPAIHGRTSVQIFIDTGRSVDGEFPHVPDLAVSMDIVISGECGPSPCSMLLIPGCSPMYSTKGG